MTREEKSKVVDGLVEKIQGATHFYLTDISALDAEKTGSLRRKCFENDITLIVAKNTLLKLALDRIQGDYDELYSALKGNTAIMLSNTGNLPAKLIKDFRKTSDRPVLKAAYVMESVYIGDNQIDALVNIKSREELIGDIVLLLQSPAKNVISALKSSGGKIAGIVKTLSEREN
ncbi:MAG: 50S ribosomal protein L10 [Bacteroidales bacterium]|nr:50S ribosomal protein L10 [Bacteroidales bacterium]